MAREQGGLQAQLSERDANLRSRGQRLWVSIGNKDLGFDQRERVCDEVGKLSRADLVRFITQLRSRTSDRLILCSYGQGHEHDERITGSLSTIHGHFGSMPPPSRPDLASHSPVFHSHGKSQAIKSRPIRVGWKNHNNCDQSRQK